MKTQDSYILLQKCYKLRKFTFKINQFTTEANFKLFRGFDWMTKSELRAAQSQGYFVCTGNSSDNVSTNPYFLELCTLFLLIGRTHFLLVVIIILILCVIIILFLATLLSEMVFSYDFINIGKIVSEHTL